MPPKPLTKSSALPFAAAPRSPTIAAQISSAMASARQQLDAAAARLAVDADAELHLVVGDLEGRLAGGGHGARGQRHAHRAGRAIDLVAELLQFLQRHAFLGGGADDLFHHQRAGDAAAAGRIERILDRHVVIGDRPA